MSRIPHLISILPLPHILLLPQTRASVHLPRFYYSQIQETSFAGAILIGFVFRDVQGQPHGPVLPIGCVGEVTRIYNLPCGQAVHLDVQGRNRFRILESSIEGGCGKGWVEVIEDHAGTLSPYRKNLLFKLLADRGVLKGTRPDSDRTIQRGHSDEFLVNQACIESNLSPSEKYFLLEADALELRCGRLVDLLRLRREDAWLSRENCRKDP